ncbi:MFS transporter [Pseudonocardia bannensis]|uniref:MFS transporter n=1 Tax=Pseudonocardia bannensis TaxID=630973 RepID=A0A848DB48_9PSEU|nr:MFS transporter [Pseudonocardia bannensis]
MPRAALRRVLVVLCVTEVVSWGVLYYAFPVLAPSIAADTGWSPGAMTAAFSSALVVAALVGIPVGRALDRWGPRAVMTAGSVLAVPSVVGIAVAESVWWFLAAWLVAGVAMAGVLYQPAFAALTRWWGPRQVAALTALTLIAGLSSTVFAPLTAALIARMDWRDTYLVLAAVLAVTTIPLHLFGLRGQWPEVEPAPGWASRDPGPVARSRPFVLLTVAMTLAAFAVYAVLINLVPLLLGRGLDTATAALALGLGGVGQVAGRLFYGRLVAATGVRSRTALIIGACAGTTGLLAVVPGPAVLLVVISVVVGAARGIFTLLQATAVSDRWGAAHYGRLNGVISAPMLIATAVAPWAGTALAALLGGYPAVFLLLAGIAAGAALISATGGTPARAAR